MKTSRKPKPQFVATTNACKACNPLGACIAYKGIEGGVPFLHGSQGCATYMRRYLISHYNEPVDIASSALGEKHAVYGGKENLKLGLKNVMAKYKPKVIGIATTCLTETIGDDVKMFVHEYCEENNLKEDMFLISSTPSYNGSHIDGFHRAVKATVERLSEGGEKEKRINIFPNLLSPADIRHLKDIIEDFGIDYTILPDISETLDGASLAEYTKIPEGGTPIDDIKKTGKSKATVEFGSTLGLKSDKGIQFETAGEMLQKKFDVSLYKTGIPIGIRETDVFFNILQKVTGNETPAKYQKERGRLIDSYVDCHKYLSLKKAVIYGEEDLVVALTSFLSEIGVVPVICASGGRSGGFSRAIENVTSDILKTKPIVMDGVDFYDIKKEVEEIKPDLIIGNSKGFHLAKEIKIPLIRVGFPIHDRMGGQRMLHVGYKGTQNLLDIITNEIIRIKQEGSDVGYSYM